MIFEAVDPVCPACGNKVRDTVSEFLFSGEELPTLEDAWARVTGHKCGCGHKFVVVTYRSDEPGDDHMLPKAHRAHPDKPATKLHEK
jgi:hypothetical protein